jgi:hypothetical protein
MRLFRVLILSSLLAAAGCHSRYVEATVSNRTSEPIQLLEVDYPSASFGIQTLAPGQDFHYRFKVLGQGKMKLTYTDKANHQHQFDGPLMNEGAEGPMNILIEQDGTRWSLNLHH